MDEKHKYQMEIDGANYHCGVSVIGNMSAI